MNTNDLNPLESRMRSWTPRRPSPALEQRLFGREATRSAGRHPSERRLPGWGWLAPVVCLFVLALQIATPDADRRPATSGSLSASIVSDAAGYRVVLAYAPVWVNSSMNNVNGETFHWTNRTTAPSPMRTLPVSLTLTNGLIQ